MVRAGKEKYTLESVVAALKKLVKEDIPQEFKEWAADGITYVERNPDADVLDYPNNIFAYIRKEPLPPKVRELVEGILMQGVRQGNAAAACNLGALYYTGQIGEQSYQKAMDLYEIAAAGGDVQAAENLGYCYYYGRSCEIDYRRAFEYFSKGAFCGRVVSLYKIGDMYRKGYYVTKDEAEAFRIYSHCLDIVNSDREAAKEFDADVYLRYGDCLLNGTGCEKDPLTALYWAQLAEYEYRRREQANEPFASYGKERAVNLVSRCRYSLDGHQSMPVS